ncbi:AMP-binding protein [Carboxylicivirga sediminis]|uniref:AMP-binding protein n=1 Tax=Carboxylicivirga sediminis TaxID=2006564 RepID=A0A941F6I1_9BACT|nr:AMP-binding protein [Carboxylicivirga sediminis]MBR8537723.1 AMP-binding protein [Carboxylicivirga sediminis]
MKQHHPIIIGLAKGLFALLRFILGARYKVNVKGRETLNSQSPKLILPNHQAIMDPILLFAYLYKYTTAVPVMLASYFDIPVAKWLFKAWGAVRVSDLEGGSRNTNVLKQIVSSVDKGLMMNKNIVLYPSGQIAAQGFERIINKQSAQLSVQNMPDGAEVIAVRISGLWGSRWSKAWMGQSPSFFPTLFKSVGLVLSNLLFFMPRRTINIEFVNITAESRAKSREGKAEFNRYLESIYNIKGEEAVSYIRYHFISPPVKRELPEKIAGSDKVLKKQSSASNVTIPSAVFSKVQACIASILEIDAQTIEQKSYLQLDLGADSLNIVEIISEVENQFPSFSAPQINDIKTVEDLCLVAMGQFKSESDLKPSTLQRPLSEVKRLTISNDGTILQQFINTFSKHGNDPFCYDAMLGSTTRKEFFLKACVVAELLKKESKEQHVGILLPALQSTTLLIAACYLAGKVPVMLNWTVGKKVLLHCLATTGVQTILSAGAFVDKIDEQLPEEIKNKIILLEKKVPQISLITKLKGALKAKFPQLLINTKNKPDTAVILFTSGSEAMPKAVPLSHNNIVSNLSAAFQLVDIDNNQVFLSFLPPFHSFGFTVLNIMPLLTAIKVGYTPNPTDSREVLRILKHIKANVLVGTPGFLKLLLAEGTSAAYAFKSVKFAISGAEAMPISLKEHFEAVTDSGLILEGYGITECSPVLTLNPQVKQKLNSVGRFLPGIEAKILNLETNEALPVGQPGMIYVSGPNVFDGYLNQPELHPFETIDGKCYYKTGDLGYLDEEGYLFITGRLKRFIKIAGEMISLPFIEKILLDKYGRDDEQVLAVEGSDKSQPPRIALFTKDNIDLKEANEHLLKNGVAPIAKLREVISIDEIPVLGTGKTDYKVLKAMLET